MSPSSTSAGVLTGEDAMPASDAVATGRAPIRHTKIRGVPWFAARGAAGLSVGRGHVSYVEIARTAQKWDLRHIGHARTNGRPFAAETSSSAAASAPALSQVVDPVPSPSALVAALREAVGDRAPRFGPLHVSVPDAATRMNLFELDAVPASRAAQDSFVEFRMGRESGPTRYRYVSQPLGRANSGKQLLLGLALEERWHLAIEGALKQAGLRAWSLNANGLRQFNLHHARICARSGALVTLEPDTWSLAIWDAGGLLRYSRAQWRVDGLDAQEIAAEIERSIIGYVHGESGRTVDQIWVCAGTDTPELTELLNTRASTPCQVLSTVEHLGTGVDQDALQCEAALAAALQS